MGPQNSQRDARQKSNLVRGLSAKSILTPWRDIVKNWSASTLWLEQIDGQRPGQTPKVGSAWRDWGRSYRLRQHVTLSWSDMPAGRRVSVPSGTGA